MNYNVLRKIVASCVIGGGNSPHFKMNMFKLKKKVAALGLIPLMYKTDYESKRVAPDDITLLMEYFKEEKVAWFDSRKEYLTLIFIRQEDMCPDLQELLTDLFESRYDEENPTYECRPGGTLKEVKHPTFKDSGKCNKNDRHKRPVRHFDVVSDLADIVGLYPCYTAVIAKYVKGDTISLNIRFRANSILINSEIEDPSTETEPGPEYEDPDEGEPGDGDGDGDDSGGEESPDDDEDDDEILDSEFGDDDGAGG